MIYLVNFMFWVSGGAAMGAAFATRTNVPAAWVMLAMSIAMASLAETFRRDEIQSRG